MTYLGRHVTHPVHGLGVVIFEEDARREASRLLTVAFSDALEDVVAPRMREHGYKTLKTHYSGPRSYKRLPGHDAVEGWALDVQAAREALREREMVV